MYLYSSGKVEGMAHIFETTVWSSIIKHFLFGQYQNEKKKTLKCSWSSLAQIIFFSLSLFASMPGSLYVMPMQIHSNLCISTQALHTRPHCLLYDNKGNPRIIFSHFFSVCSLFFHSTMITQLKSGFLSYEWNIWKYKMTFNG